MSGVFHQAERLNREVALLTTFELAYEKYLTADRKDIRGVVQRDPTSRRPLKYTPDEAFELAIEEARDVAGLTLGDYTRQMKGRIFTIPSVNVISQFKQYAIAATYNILRDFYLSVAAPFRKGEIEQFRQQMIKDGLSQTVIDERLDEAEAYVKERVALHQLSDPPACNDEEKWTVPEKWALMKEGGKRATKLYDIKPEEEVAKGYYLEHRPAVYKRCQEYCAVNKFCPHFNDVTF